MNHQLQRLTGLALLLITASLLLLAGCHVPFLPQNEIDSFPLDEELIETMEVQGIRYTRVINPQAAGDPTAPAAIWVPSSAAQGGSYQAYTAFLPRTDEQSEVAAAGSAAAPAAAATETAVNEESSAAETRENELQEKQNVDLPLRRRALIFPSRISAKRPDIISLLSLELEERLPLRVNESEDPALRQSGRLLSSRAEIGKAARNWLKKQKIPTTFQFLIYIDSSSGRNFHFYTCTWIDAQTGNKVASFTFRADLKGRLLRPLVPDNPAPLRHLVNATSWWCKIRSRKEVDNYLLEAGHLSDLNYGRKLTVFNKVTPIRDPRSKKPLGFLFSEALGEVYVSDFFAADGSLAQSRKPLKASFKEAWALEIPSAENQASAPAIQAKDEENSD